MRLVLASTSRYRQALLQRLLGPLGQAFEAARPDVDEDLSDAEQALPVAERATILAVRKARAVAHREGYQRALVIGSDQICVDPEGLVLHKPQTETRALAQLARLSGRTHQLVTAVAVVRVAPDNPDNPDNLDDRAERAETLATAVDVHRLTMRPLGPEALARYLACDRPLDCAGSYRLESLGLALFDKIEADPETADESAIVGLPLMKTLRLLRDPFGWDPLAF
ncbi:MAG TPA: Maf family protein [Myxococcota bacterium]|nr:Maf family protein [Myxococcota bacterium]